MKHLKSTKTTFLRIVCLAGLVTLFAAASANAQNLQTREIDLDNCIQMSFRQQLVIRNRDAFFKTIRNDFSRQACLKNLEKIDFDKYTLLGIELNTGYCRRPLALESQAVKNEAEKQITLKIRYLEPRGTCRALSQYDYWVLVPKLAEDYTVEFEVAAEARPAANQ